VAGEFMEVSLEVEESAEPVDPWHEFCSTAPRWT
jgi:hypothetical protein